MNKYLISIGLLLLSLNFLLGSCDDNYPKSKETPYETKLLSIQITNGGADGKTVFEGKIDEYKKEINFSRMDTATNFESLTVEADLSEGAQLAQYTYDFSMDSSEAYKVLTLRVKNHNRYMDYFMKVRKDIPVFGADFEKPTVYNFSGDFIYPDFSGLSTRGASFDGEHVLIVARTASGPHLLKVSDLKNGEIKPITLDLTNVSGGTFDYNTGALANGHVYIANLATSFLKIYYWDTPTSIPETLLNISLSDIPGSAARYGDNISVSIDENGNGFIFFGANNSSSILRLTVTNHKTIDTPVILACNPNTKGFMGINRIAGTDQFVWSGVATPIMLTDESAGVKYTMNASNTAAEAIDPRIFTFNEERYLIACAAGYGSASKATPTIYVYNITKGATVEDALKNFDNAENHNPDYTFILGGAGNAAPGTYTGYYVEKDDSGKDAKLYVFGARAGSGFAICEFPIKTQED